MVLLHTLLFAAAVTAKCYEATTAHPLPDLSPKDPLLKDAFASIETTLGNIIGATEFDAQSFMVEVTSTEKTLWGQYHTARERNASRPDIPKVNGDALFRIASITKTFTVLGILQQHEAGNLHLDDSVDKYIAELREKQLGTIPWKDITLRILASQLSGIPREFAQGDLINNLPGEPRPEDLGLPPLSKDGLIACDEYSPNYEIPCTAHDLLNAVRTARPVLAPNLTPTYSNVAFELLGLVIERVTNKTYNAYIEDAIFKPLRMTKSTLTTPADAAGVIPLQPHYWDVDAGIQSPTGAIYSSTKDMSKYLRYILTHYNAIATGVNWFNTGASSSGVYSFYGMPWETFQTDRILKDSKRMVRFVTKSGGLPGYASIVIMLQEYGIGITILVAGASDGTLLDQIREVVTTNIARAVEAISIRQLNERYIGTYTSTDKTLNTTLTLIADERGLVVEQFISNGTDVLRNGYRNPSGEWYAQVVPTLLYLDEENKEGEIWRVLTQNVRSAESSVWDDFCVFDIDHPVFAAEGFNELIFADSRHKKYNRVQLSAFRANLTRVSEKKKGWWGTHEEILEL